MTLYNRKHFWIAGLVITAISFALLFAGMKWILGNDITTRNIIAFCILSLIFGGISSALYFIRFKIGFLLFLAGLAMGFFDMYRMFITGMNGWGDLTGLISLFVWAAIGLAVGAVAELLWYFYKKIKEGSRN